MGFDSRPARCCEELREAISSNTPIVLLIGTLSERRFMVCRGWKAYRKLIGLVKVGRHTYAHTQAQYYHHHHHHTAAAAATITHHDHRCILPSMLCIMHGCRADEGGVR